MRDIRSTHRLHHVCTPTTYVSKVLLPGTENGTCKLLCQKDKTGLFFESAGIAGTSKRHSNSYFDSERWRPSIVPYLLDTRSALRHLIWSQPAAVLLYLIPHARSAVVLPASASAPAVADKAALNDARRAQGGRGGSWVWSLSFYVPEKKRIE